MSRCDSAVIGDEVNGKYYTCETERTDASEQEYSNLCADVHPVVPGGTVADSEVGPAETQ